MDDTTDAQFSSEELSLADRYVAGECRAEEIRIVEQLMTTNPERWTRVHALREAFVVRNAETSSDDVLEAAREALWSRIAPAGPSQPTFEQAQIRRHRRATAHWSRSRLLLGGLAAVMGMGILFTIGDAHVPTTPPRVYTTRAGERARVTLDDGSIVRLGPATTIAVRSRDVTVDGEALFTVTTQTRTPFLVRTSQALTRVLGTQFVVRKYRTDGQSQIIVESGRVSVQSIQQGTRSAVLDAGMLARVSDPDSIVVTRNVVPQQLTTLLDGRLAFVDRPLSEIVPDLSRVYDVEIRITDSVLAKRPVTFTASIASESLNDVLDVLATTLDAHYIRTGRTVMFAPGVRTSTRHRQSPFTVEMQYGR